MIQIPISNQPNQSFSVTIPIGNTNISLGFFLYWNRIAEYWEMNLTNAVTGAALITGLPMVTGAGLAANLLEQFEYLGIGKAYIAPLTKEAPDYPGVDDWGVNFALLWGE